MNTVPGSIRVRHGSDSPGRPHIAVRFRKPDSMLLAYLKEITDSPMSPTSSLTALPAWQALEQHAAAMRDVHMRDLFAEDP